MNDDLARRLLLEGDHHQRLDAARSLLGRVQPADRHLISTAAKREDDQYVRAALFRLLVSLPSDSPRPAEGPTADAARASEDIRSQLVRDLTYTLTHEVATVVTTLGHYAEREVPEYEASETKRELVRLEGVLQALRQLGDAAAAPQWETLDLARLVGGVVQDERIVHSYPDILVSGDDPHEVTGSEGLLSLFLRNAIANAVEATIELHGEARPLVVSWGTDDREHWLAVVDEGPGPPGGLDVFAEMGASTKDGHPGLGLTIASQVAVSLGGVLALEAQERGGSVCRLTWVRGGSE